jgi:hypothetical protein
MLACDQRCVLSAQPKVCTSIHGLLESHDSCALGKGRRKPYVIANACQLVVLFFSLWCVNKSLTSRGRMQKQSPWSWRFVYPDLELTSFANIGTHPSPLTIQTPTPTCMLTHSHKTYVNDFMHTLQLTFLSRRQQAANSGSNIIEQAAHKPRIESTHARTHVHIHNYTALITITLHFIPLSYTLIPQVGHNHIYTVCIQ